MTMTKEEKIELKELRKRLKQIERDTAKETKTISREETASERREQRAERDAVALALRKNKAAARECRATRKVAHTAHRSEMRALEKRRILADKTHGETKAVMDRIAVIEGRLAA